MSERDPELEAKAIKVLSYTTDQVKRKTMAELKRELKDSRHHADSQKKKTRNVTFSEQEANNDDQSSRHSRSVDSPGRGRETENDHLNHLMELHHVLRAKVKFTAQLERDPDFSQSDLIEWDKSVERSRRRLNDALAKSELSANGGADVKKLWKRREEKIAEMQDLGLLDGELLKAWQAKQNLLKKIYQDLQPQQE